MNANKEELVSIIIPVYNRSKLVGSAIESAQNQTYTIIEIIIGDNCSTDETWEIVEEYRLNEKRIKSFRNNYNIGPVRNWLECLKLVEGKYCCFLWSDDQLMPDFVEKCLKEFSDNVAFVLSGIELNNEKGLLSRTKYQTRGKINSKEYLKSILLTNEEGYPSSPAGALFRTKDIIDNLLLEIPNNFDLDFSRYGAGNDLLIYLLTANNYTDIKFANTIGCKYFLHENSLSIKNDLSFYYYYSKYYYISLYAKYLSSNFVSLLIIKSIKDLQYFKLIMKFKSRFYFNIGYLLKSFFRMLRIKISI